MNDTPPIYTRRRAIVASRSQEPPKSTPPTSNPPPEQEHGRRRSIGLKRAEEARKTADRQHFESLLEKLSPKQLVLLRWITRKEQVTARCIVMNGVTGIKTMVEAKSELATLVANKVLNSYRDNSPGRGRRTMHFTVPNGIRAYLIAEGKQTVTVTESD